MKTMMNDNASLSFADVHARVMARADEALPDRTVHVADLRMTPAGHVALPGGAEYRLNDFARANLATMLGLRWDRWFQNASGEERADEINRRFARTPGERKIRAWKNHDGDADGIARAFLAPTAAPIDDRRVFERMHTMLRGLMDEYRFPRVEFTDATTHYTAVHAEGMDVDGRGDLLHPGFHLRNSEVSATALSLDDHWLRLVCTNGLMVQVGKKRSLYRTHRTIDDDALAAALVVAVGRLPDRWRVSFEWMRAARTLDVPHPDDAVVRVLGGEVPKALVEEARRVVLRDGDRTRFGVVQAITYVAHAQNKDPDVRFTMERLAGEYLAATAEVTAAA